MDITTACPCFPIMFSILSDKLYNLRQTHFVTSTCCLFQSVRNSLVLEIYFIITPKPMLGGHTGVNLSVHSPLHFLVDTIVSSNLDLSNYYASSIPPSHIDTIY